MGRTVRSDSSNKPNVKPVDKISLSEKNVVLRLIGVVVLLVIAAFAFAYAINGWLSTESGWTTIEADSASEINCSNDFVFSYHLGRGDTSATVENKALRIINPSDVVCHAKWNITVEYDENGYLLSETFETVNSHKDPDTKTVYGSATYSYAN